MTSTGQLVFYVNPLWRRQGIHTPLLNPWWGNPLTDSSLYTKELFDSYSFSTAYYAITDDLGKADMVLAPYPHVWFMRHDMVLFDECVRTARGESLPLLIDGTGDIEYPINIENAYILRYSGYRFLPERRRIQIPLFADDLLERCRGGRLAIRKKGEGKPNVGFAGWARLSLKQYLRTVIKELPMRLRGIFDTRYRACTKGVLWRQKAIKILQSSPHVTFNLRVRNSFTASVKTAEGDMQKLQEEMVDTILQSDYALDVRGDANNSARLFEILSLGRIPIIIDTERNFPFSDKVDYSSFALIIDFHDIKCLPERVAEFHKRISPERFEQMQRNARDAYVNYFRVDALMCSIVEELHMMVPRRGGSV
ncbi:MAG: Exostosin family protein [Parcubacteria group bacterium GW2011_GWB1_55_9]|nr:MAG: Exostosin family protein [Parcubacteria group bacterium GW2011_GWB1_55_9]